LHSRIILFSIVNNSDYFAIDKHTGRLYTKSPIDFELTHERLFKLRIKIEGQSSTEEGVYFGLKIEIINVNDNRPKFESENETLFINEKSPLGQQIFKFHIVDHDLRIDDELML
jgi:hypothetical protein